MPPLKNGGALQLLPPKVFMILENHFKDLRPDGCLRFVLMNIKQRIRKHVSAFIQINHCKREIAFA